MYGFGKFGKLVRELIQHKAIAYALNQASVPPIYGFGRLVWELVQRKAIIHVSNHALRPTDGPMALAS